MSALDISLIVVGVVIFVGVAGFFGYKFCKKNQATAVVYESVNN